MFPTRPFFTEDYSSPQSTHQNGYFLPEEPFSHANSSKSHDSSAHLLGIIGSKDSHTSFSISPSCPHLISLSHSPNSPFIEKQKNLTKQNNNSSSPPKKTPVPMQFVYQDKKTLEKKTSSSFMHTIYLGPEGYPQAVHSEESRLTLKDLASKEVPIVMAQEAMSMTQGKVMKLMKYNS